MGLNKYPWQKGFILILIVFRRSINVPRGDPSRPVPGAVGAVLHGEDGEDDKDYSGL